MLYRCPVLLILWFKLLQRLLQPIFSWFIIILPIYWSKWFLKILLNGFNIGVVALNLILDRFLPIILVLLWSNPTPPAQCDSSQFFTYWFVPNCDLSQVSPLGFWGVADFLLLRLSLKRAVYIGLKATIQQCNSLKKLGFESFNLPHEAVQPMIIFAFFLYIIINQVISISATIFKIWCVVIEEWGINDDTFFILYQIQRKLNLKYWFIFAYLLFWSHNIILFIDNISSYEKCRSSYWKQIFRID